MKYKVQLQAVVNATLWIECEDEYEAKSIAQRAWTPRLSSACIDRTVDEIYNYDVGTYADNTLVIDVEQV